MRGNFIAIIAMGLALSGCASEYSISPMPDGTQQVRYEQGAATLYSEEHSGVVQVTPIKVTDDMRLAFGVAAYNKSRGPSNFGVENVSLAEVDGSADKIFTSSELIHEAKVKAEWAAFATALAGGLAAGSAYSTTSGTAYTPVGPISYQSTSYDPAQAAEIRAETRDDLANIKSSLDHTISGIRNTALQTTTVNPGDSYGGIVVADKLSSSKFPQSVALHVNWNGEDHAFNFMVAEGPPQVPQANPPRLPEASIAPTTAPTTSAAVTTAAKLPYGYADNSPTPEASAVIAPQAVRFDQWNKKKSAH